MLLIDVHAHLDLDEYKQYGDVDRLIEECKNNGVVAIVANGVTIESNKKILEIAARHDIVKIALGIYPTHCLEMFEQNKKELFDDEIRFIEDQIKHKKCVAIGEIGLEYKEVKNITDKQKNIQKTCLKKFCDLAKKYNIPVIVHSRGAETEIVEFLENIGMKNHKVIMHCYSGRKHIIQRIKNNRWFFSIPCNLNRSEHFQNIVKEIPLTQIFTESDAPYLSPFSGKTNRPDNVRLTIKKIAQIKGLSEEETANIIYNNYQKLFL